MYAMAEKGYDFNMPQPEPLKILRMLRNANTSYWAGGLADQPYFLLLELNAAANGERKYADRKADNVRKLLGTPNG